MTTVMEIPLQPRPQKMNVSFGQSSYGFETRYLDCEFGGWVLDLYDGYGNPLACGLAMVTGADLLAGLGYLGFPGKLFIATDGNPLAPPTAETLGVTSHLMVEVE